MEIKRLLTSLAVLFAFIPLHECISERICITPKVAECNRDLRDSVSPVNVQSVNYKANFMCDTKTDGGGWIIIQRRFRKDTSFNKGWNSYKFGFGLVCSDYWIGNEKIHDITSKGFWELRIDMVYKRKPYYAQYSEFYVESEKENYRMHFRNFIGGNAQDMLQHHNGQPFSTPDKDNTDKRIGCATKYEAGWWYWDCHTSNLNGVFNDKKFGRGVIWEILTTDHDSLDSVEMKIRQILGNENKSEQKIYSVGKNN